MPEVTFTQEDILSSQEMPSTWYPLAMKTCNEGPGKKDPSSTTYECEFEVIDGQFKGAVLKTWFSSKMMKNVIRYLKCFVASPVVGQSYELSQTVGKPVMGYVKWDIENLNNVIMDYKPVGR